MHYIAVTFEIVPEVFHHCFDWQTSLGNLCCPIIHQMLCALCGLMDSLSFLRPKIHRAASVSLSYFFFISVTLAVLEIVLSAFLNIIVYNIVYSADSKWTVRVAWRATSCCYAISFVLTFIWLNSKPQIIADNWYINLHSEMYDLYILLLYNCLPSICFSSVCNDKRHCSHYRALCGVISWCRVSLHNVQQKNGKPNTW